MTTSWRPILQGELQERALESAREMGRVLADSFARDALPPTQGDASLSRGWTGTAITMHYLHGAFPAEGFDLVSDAALDRAVAAVAEQRMNPGLLQGFPGIAWALEHLGQNDDAEDGTSAVDDALIAMLGSPRWSGLYDLVSGLVGIGVYALARLPSASARKCLELVVERLRDWSEPGDPGLTWFTRPELIPPSARERVPEGYYNLGLAHGVPGVVALLAQAHRAGIAQDATATMLEGAVAWVLAQALPPGGRATWPYFVGPGIELRPARLAWCYGDAGVVAALFQAADALGRADWEEAAQAALGRAVARPPGSSDVQGASLCHGAMGLAHLWNRMWQRTRSDELRASIHYWTTVALDLRTYPDGLAGYSVWDPGSEEEDGGDVQGPGLLAGVGGIALALVGAATDQEPAWDSHLLLSEPRAGRPRPDRRSSP
ncbi:MAG TPA: lanthionine synthetase C family protein [Actinomycetota bacterium]|nr:lanthionine synthetase C family protein [Actinomycetota bacterium]